MKQAEVCLECLDGAKNMARYYRLSIVETLFGEFAMIRERDAAFREALFTEGVNAMLAGDVETGKAFLRDYIKEVR